MESAGDVPQLTAQFFVTLRAKVRRAAGSDREAIFRRIEELKKKAPGPCWHVPYEIEQLLCLVFDDAMLDVELVARLAESKRRLTGTKHEYHAAEAKKAVDAGDRERKRAVLLRIVDDLQWSYTTEELAHDFGRQVRSKYGWWLIVAIVVFCAAAIVLLPVKHEYVIVSLVAGLLGAVFSINIGAKTQLETSSFDDLKLVRRFWTSLPRAVVGMGAALILLFLVQSGLLAGRAFPKFERGEVTVDAVQDALHETVASAGYDPAKVEDATEAAVDAQIEVGAMMLAPLLLATGPEVDDTYAAQVAAVAAKIAGAAGGVVKAEALSPIAAARLKSLESTMLALDSVSLITLVVWCFIAGFSEKLVPGMLARVESRAVAAASASRRPETVSD